MTGYAFECIYYVIYSYYTYNNSIIMQSFIMLSLDNYILSLIITSNRKCIDSVYEMDVQSLDLSCSFCKYNDYINCL